MPESKVAIVAGAGSGVGREVAVQLAQAGYHVVLAARTLSALEDTAARIRDEVGEAVRILVVPTDLTDPAANTALVQQTVDEFGRIDALANVAGYAPNLPIAEITPEICKRCLDTNLGYVVQLAAAAWDTFAKQKSGVVVNVSSLASFDPFPGFAVYAAAKVGVNMFTHVLADEGKAIGLKAVCVAPGAVETAMLRSIFDEQMVPTDQTLAPKEVAAVIVDCITGKRQFKPGETIKLPSG